MDPNNNKKINSKILNKKGEKLSIEQSNGFNLKELENFAQYKKLNNEEQKNNLKECYKAINPKKPISLLSREKNKSIEIGGYNFIDDIDKICKAIIEVLYLLRNSLFHGEIIPGRETNNVYEPAYNILYGLVA